MGNCSIRPKWPKEDLDRAREAIKLIRHPQCSDEDALAIIVSVMNIAEVQGQLNCVNSLKGEELC